MGNLLSIVLLGVGFYISYFNQTGPYLNILMVYSFIGLLVAPLALIASCSFKEGEINNFKYLNSMIIRNILWIFIWCKMITLDYIFSGAAGLAAVIISYMMLIIIKQLSKEEKKRINKNIK